MHNNATIDNDDNSDKYTNDTDSNDGNNDYVEQTSPGDGEGFGRGDDTVGNPRRAQISQFELFELILLLKIGKQRIIVLEFGIRRVNPHLW